MYPLKAHVENGRIVVDEPVNLPDGTLLTVVVTKDVEERSWDELTDDERRIQQTMPWVHFARLSSPPLTAVESDQLDRSLAQLGAGDIVAHEEVMRELGLEEFSNSSPSKVDAK